MPDIFSRKKRSEIMSKIRGKNTKAELAFRKALSAVVYPKGLRYRIHYRKLPGSPDVAFVKLKIAIFIDGDFWHGRNFKQLKPRLPNRFWREKIARNITRDRKNRSLLRKAGWHVLRVWESDLKTAKRKMETIEKVRNFILRNKGPAYEWPL